MDEQIFIYIAMVPLLGMLAQLLAWWIRVPSILLLLTFGVALGFWMNPDQILAGISGDPDLGAKIVFPFVSVAVAVILFEGGLTLQFSDLQKKVGSAVVRLCTVGVLISWVLGSWLAWWLLDLPLKLAILLGAVLVVTGPTVVMPLLRHIRPTRNVGSIVKWEGIIIDPIGAILAVLVFEQLFHVSHNTTGSMMAWESFVNLSKTAAIGLGFGGFAAAALVVAVKRYWIPDYLHGLTFLSTAIAVFALSNLLMHESGLVTVTVMGICLANQRSISIEHVIEFKENLGVFLISCLFIVLGSRLNLSVMGDVGWNGVVFVLLMILIVRPLSVFGSMLGAGLKRNEQIFLACLAPRGIVAAAVVSVFALRILATADHGGELGKGAEVLVPATFMLIVGSVAIYGLGAAPLARRLGLADANPQGILFAGAEPWIRDVAKTLSDAGYTTVLVDTNYQNVSAAKMSGLQAYCKSILSESAQEEIDFAGVGRMFALTRNDAVNAIAAKEYSHIFGSKNVYRLKPQDAEKGQRSKVGHVAKGRELFSDDWSESRLQHAYQKGFRSKLTKISDEFRYADFQKQHGDDAVVLMVIDKNGLIQVNTADVELEPTEGQTVLALVQPDAKTEG